MKIVFFGTAGAIQSKDNTNVSFSVVEKKLSILVDSSGNPVQCLKRVSIDPTKLDVLILTHFHTDHIYALPSLIHNLWLMKRKEPLNIISNQFTINKAKELCNVFSLLSKESLFSINWVNIDEGEIDVFPGVKIQLFPVLHSAPTSGVKIITSTSSLVYASDTSPSKEVINRASGVKALIHEASGTLNLEKELNKTGHSSGRQAGEVAKKARVKFLFLCHFDFREGSVQDKVKFEAKNSFQGKVIVPELFRFYEV